MGDQRGIAVLVQRLGQLLGGVAIGFEDQNQGRLLRRRAEAEWLRRCLRLERLGVFLQRQLQPEARASSGWQSKPILPFICWTSERVMASPSPVPPR